MFKDPLADKEYRDKVLGYHPANTDTAKRHAGIRNAAMTYSDVLFELVPDSSPERTLAFRHIQHAMMLSNAAIAISDGEPVPDNSAIPHDHHDHNKQYTATGSWIASKMSGLDNKVEGPNNG